MSATRSKVGEVELHGPAPDGTGRMHDAESMQRGVDAARRPSRRTTSSAAVRRRRRTRRRPRPRARPRPARARRGPRRSASGSALDPVAQPANRCHCAGSASSGATAGGKNGTYTLAHGLPRHAHARGGASVAELDDHRRGRLRVRARAGACTRVKPPTSRRPAVGTGLIRRPRRSGRAPGPVAVIAQRRDRVGDRVGRCRGSPRDAGAGRREPVVGDRRSACAASGSASKSVPGATSADASVQSVESEIAVRDRGAVADRARGPRAVARLDRPSRRGRRRRGTTRSTARRVRARRPPCRARSSAVGDARRARRRRCGRVRGRAARGPCRAAPAGGACGSSTVQIFSLPIATPCSFTPCSAPHSHVGCEPTNAYAPGSGDRRYCVSSDAARRSRGVGEERPALRPEGGRSSSRTPCRCRAEAQRVAHGGSRR